MSLSTFSLHRKLRLASCLAALAGLSSKALADAPLESVKEESGIFKLGTVLVFGKQPAPAELVPVELGSANMELLEKRDVAQALSTLPGVTLTRFGGRNESSVYVRGFGRNQTPIFIDGVPAYVPYDGYVDLARFTTYDIASISVAKGYSSVLYGPNAMGGAINLVSRQPRSAFEGQVNAGIFSADAYEASVNLGAKQRLWYAQLGASFVDQDTYPLSSDFVAVKAENGGDRENAYHKDLKMSGKVALTPNSTDEYAVGFVHQEGDKGTPPYTGTNAGYLKYWRWPRWDKQTVYYVSNTQLGELSYLKPRLFYDWYNNGLDQYKDASYSTLLSGSSGPSQYQDFSYGSSVELGTALVPANTLKGAFHYKFDHHDEQILAQPHYVYEDRTVSFGLEDTWHASGLLDVQFGAAFDARKALRADQLNPDNTPVKRTNFTGFNPEAGVFYKLGEQGSLHATIARKSRFPTIKDRYSYKFNTAFPNPDLRQEKVMHYELGYVGALASSLKVNGSVYFSRLQDAIQSVSNVNGTTRSQNRNVGVVENSGFDLGMEYERATWLKLGGSYTYLHQKNITSPAIKATDTPVHSGLVYATLKVCKVLSLIPSVEYSSWRYAYSDGRKTPGFSTAALKAQVELGHGLTGSLGAGNIFDKNYQLQEGYPEAGRNWFANLRYAF